MSVTLACSPDWLLLPEAAAADSDGMSPDAVGLGA
jgi:hypothetical protein